MIHYSYVKPKSDLKHIILFGTESGFTVTPRSIKESPHQEPDFSISIHLLSHAFHQTFHKQQTHISKHNQWPAFSQHPRRWHAGTATYTARAAASTPPRLARCRSTTGSAAAPASRSSAQTNPNGATQGAHPSSRRQPNFAVKPHPAQRQRGWYNPLKPYFDFAMPMFLRIAEYCAGIVRVSYHRWQTTTKIYKWKSFRNREARRLLREKSEARIDYASWGLSGRCDGGLGAQLQGLSSNKQSESEWDRDGGEVRVRMKRNGLKRHEGGGVQKTEAKAAPMGSPSSFCRRGEENEDGLDLFTSKFTLLVIRVESSFYN